MAWLKRNLEDQVQQIREQQAYTARELGQIKLRQANIQRRLQILQQELEVQMRTAR